MPRRARAVPRFHMSPDEVRMARALAVVRYVPATFDKRMGQALGAHAVDHAAGVGPAPMLSEGEARELRRLVQRYRRQIPADVVALAATPFWGG